MSTFDSYRQLDDLELILMSSGTLMIIWIWIREKICTDDTNIPMYVAHAWTVSCDTLAASQQLQALSQRLCFINFHFLKKVFFN